MPIGKILSVITLLGASAIVGAAYQAKIEKVSPKAVSPADGKAMFMEYCATCHGREGKGNGPAAGALKKTPADLTLLAAHNGGKFPEAHIARYIGGDDAILAHGSRDMPIWGDVFKSMNRDQAVTAQRVSNLTDYVKLIQGK
jgi:mono/diheme cytochrome c family protein